MDKNSLYEAGEQIRNIVQNAIDNGDFSALSDTITDVINDAVDGIQGNFRMKASHNRYEYSGSLAAERIRQEMDERRRQAAEKMKNMQDTSHVVDTTAGTAMQVTGYLLSILCGIPAAICALIGLIEMEPYMLIPVGILAGFTAAGAVLLKKGKHIKELAKRFRRYKGIIGNRKYCRFQELANATGVSEKDVVSDIHEMLDKAWFKEGYLDNEETMIITDRETYQQYSAARENYLQRKAAEARTASQTSDEKDASGTDYSNLPPQCQELIREGQKYITHIRSCNDRIPGEEITKKLNRMEHTVSRIFLEVANNPSAAGDLKKMMSYYLPTTIKLLDAYCDLEEQKVRGKNIDSTKQEIDLALDTINLAFENLLDSLFEDQAWDISSDISVLNTMLAQEGLTGSDFENMTQQGMQ